MSIMNYNKSLTWKIAAIIPPFGDDSPQSEPSLSKNGSGGDAQRFYNCWISGRSTEVVRWGSTNICCRICRRDFWLPVTCWKLYFTFMTNIKCPRFGPWRCRPSSDNPICCGSRWVPMPGCHVSKNREGDLASRPADKTLYVDLHMHLYI